MNYTVYNPEHVDPDEAVGYVDRADIDIAAHVIASNDHAVCTLRNDFDLPDGIRLDTASVTLALNSQPLQYKALRQALCWFMRTSTFPQLECIHLQVGRRFLRECRSMGRWKHIERMFNQRATHVAFVNNNPLSYSNDPEVSRFREFLVRGATASGGLYIHARPSASRTKRPIRLVVTLSEELPRVR